MGKDDCKQNQRRGRNTKRESLLEIEFVLSLGQQKEVVQQVNTQAGLGNDLGEIPHMI